MPLKDFVRDRPSLIVFSACMSIIATASFASAMYIHLTDNIINDELKNNLKSLLTYMNDDRLCIHPSPNVTLLQEEKNKFAAVNYLATFKSSSNLYGTGSIHAFIKLNSWFGCSDAFEKPNTVRVFFNLLPNLTNQDVCVRVEGPRSLLPRTRYNICDTHFDLSARWGKISQVKNRTVENCTSSGGFTAKIDFNLTIVNDDLLTVYLTDNAKHLLFESLLWITFSILFPMILILLYTFCLHKIK